MKQLKHVGKIVNNGAKVLVAFRTLPGESNYALVVPVASLSDDYHDAIMKTVETAEAQQAFEFGEIMFTRPFPDGRIMLQALQQDNKLVKVPTDNVSMNPAPGSEIILSQLNILIAEQRNCAVDELCNFVSGAPRNKDATVEEIASVNEMPQPSNTNLTAKDNEVLSDTDLARSYRSQADAMYKEAARLRRQADELDPPVKKASKVKETESA